MGFLQGLLIKFATDIFNKAVSWLYTKFMSWSKGSKYVKQTDAYVERIEGLQVKAKEEIEKTGVVSESTKEAIRAAGRDLIRGKRD